MLTDTPSHSAWSESRMGQKSVDFRCHVKQQKHVANVLPTSAHGDEVHRSRDKCAYLDPPRCHGVQISPTLRARGAKLGTPTAHCT